MANLDIARNARWQNVANFVLGAWLFISPWVLGFSDAGKVATNAWIFGIIIALLALSAIFAYQRWEEWLTAAIGVWVFISPWVLGAVSNARILWSSLVVGALLVILALWSSSLEHGSGAIVTRR
jgi:SPW repeat